jgi:hypothetical protein
MSPAPQLFGSKSQNMPAGQRTPAIPPHTPPGLVTPLSLEQPART